MKKATIVASLAAILLFGMIGFAEARVGVRGYIKRSGTYVAPHYKTNPDNSRWNNWSTKGNYNPYTGKKGYTSPYKSR